MKHGTTTGYKHHECRCERCVEAYRSYHRRYAKLKRKGLVGSKEIPEHVHGTLGGYTNWGCKCEACRAAHASDVARRKQTNLYRMVPDSAHGKLHGYHYWGCRCPECKKAVRLYTRARRARAKARRERSAA